MDPIEESKAWVSDSDLEALKLDRQVFHSDTGPVAQARRILSEASPAAAASLARLALHGESESVRLRASQLVLDYAMQNGSNGDGKEPWTEVYEKVMQELGSMGQGLVD